MKNTRPISAFLLILFLFTGCTSAPENEPSGSTADVSASVTVTDTTTAVLQTAEACAQTTATSAVTAAETTTAAVQTETSAVTSPASTKAPVTATAPVSAAEAESTAKQTETTKKSVWQLFTKPSQAGDKTSDKSESTKKNSRNTVCTVTITCTTIKQNLPMLKKGKESFVPKSGVILDNAEVAFQSGDTAFDVIQKACRENVCTDNCKYCQKSGIQLEYNYTPAFGTYYVEGIHQLYEKDCGSMSGWMFSVNGDFPTEGSSSYTVKPGDNIVFAYTCDMGDDIGNSY